jgi:hypothetical protein
MVLLTYLAPFRVKGLRNAAYVAYMCDFHLMAVAAFA